MERALKQLPAAEAKKKTDKDKARVSMMDPDARVMKMADAGFRPAFNGQFAVDTATQIVVGVDVTNEGSADRIHKRADDIIPFQNKGKITKKLVLSVNYLGIVIEMSRNQNPFRRHLSLPDQIYG